VTKDGSRAKVRFSPSPSGKCGCQRPRTLVHQGIQFIKRFCSLLAKDVTKKHKVIYGPKIHYTDESLFIHQCDLHPVKVHTYPPHPQFFFASFFFVVFSTSHSYTPLSFRNNNNNNNCNCNNNNTPCKLSHLFLLGAVLSWSQKQTRYRSRSMTLTSPKSWPNTILKTHVHSHLVHIFTSGGSLPIHFHYGSGFDCSK
jgi:hypothetical protein